MNAIPDFLQPLPVPVGVEADAGGGDGSVQRRVAGFSMTCQQEDQWCWAAVAQAVERWRGQEVSQSEIASDHVSPGRGLVCTTPLSGGNGESCGECSGPAGCGDPHSLRYVLQGREALGPGGAVRGVPSFETIVEAVEDQRPLPVRIDWGQTGHVICVTGYRTSSGGRRVLLHDPLSPGLDGGPTNEIDMPYDHFAEDYDAASGNDGRPNYSYEVTR